MNKKFSLAIVIVVAAGLAYFSFTHMRSKVHRKAVNSMYMGKVVMVPANAKLGKLKNFGGEMDEYHYLLPDETDLFKDQHKLTDVIDITEPTKFTVVEVLPLTSSSTKLHCIFEDEGGQTFGAECDDIGTLNVLYRFFEHYNQNLAKNGNVLVGRRAFQAMVRHDFEVNNIFVAKVTSDADLMNFLFYDDKEIITPMSRLNDDKIFVIDELKESEIHKWDMLGDSVLKEALSAEYIFRRNTLDLGLLNAIQKLEPHSLNNRWVFSELLVLHKKNLYNESTFQCLKEKYEGPQTEFEEHFQMLKKEASAFGFRFTGNNNIGNFNCGNLKRPFVQGDLAIKEGLI